MSQQQKRKIDEPTGRDKKKVRIAEARTIPVQPVGSGPSQAGPSKVVPMNSLSGLPSAIDIEKVVESRAFEIGAMQTAMKTASSSSTQRAWQALPRHLRRRAASHDVRRVPQRLRGRAISEMDALPPKKKKLPKRGKGNQESRTESFLRRQKDKSWLETHIWHSKRMHMENIWGYRLATKPTEKAYRPSHRASVQGSIIHDASYFSLVELKASSETIVGVLSLCCDPQDPNPGAMRFLTGGRTDETHIYEPGSYPFGLISPISVIWQPIPEPGEFAKKGKEKELNVSTSQDRVAWLRFHPGVHQQVLSALEGAASQYLAKKKAEGIETLEIQICDLKDQINVFEIMGPEAAPVIRGALSAVPGDNREEFKQFWSSMADIQCAGDVPRNMVVGFKVLDPRLRFPPKKATPKPVNQRNGGYTFPSGSLSRSDLWDESIRLGLCKPKYTKKELDDRRSKNIVPGTPLNPQRQDNRVPVLLIQRSLETSQSRGGKDIHGWTLIIPSGWGMAFWSSLVFNGTRVAGQRERQTQAYEAGTAYFPRDYPFTTAYQRFSAEQEENSRADWERKPPAKRTNFEKLHVKDSWAPNWHGILRIQASGTAEGNNDLVATQREPVNAIKPWLLRGSDIAPVIQLLASPFHSPGDTLVCEINRWRTRRSLDPLPTTINGQDLLRGALVMVRVDVCKRGVPHDLALIYSIDDDKVKLAIASSESQVGNDEEAECESEEIPSEDALIGRVTTGNYSLSKGSGYAIGAVSLVKWLQIIKQPTTKNYTEERPVSPYVYIRNTNSSVCRLARLQLLIEGDPPRQSVKR